MLLFVLLVVSAVSGSAHVNDKRVSPLSIPPSQYWDGDDGPWSTFGIQAGTPAQQFRVLPANGLDSIWLVHPEGCSSTDPGCASSRGGVFQSGDSSTWQEIGIYDLSLYEESMLGYSGNGVYGTENITLGWPGNNLPSVSKQVVAGIATTEFYIGALGLDPWPVNFTQLGNSRPSLLSSLKNESMIPSLTWGYTAGAFHHDPPVFGSLTLGGFDSSRFVPNELNFTMGADISRDLLVAVQSITTNSSSVDLLPSPVFAFINSLVPYMWLPTDACTQFEKAFNLTYDDAAGLYSLTDAQHQQLLAQNPTVTFNIGPTASGKSAAITMPYSGFDLQANEPLVTNSSKYFPLQRAANSTQYTLGRVFLQSAYVIANYEFFNFSVSQALYPDTSVPEQIITLCPREGCAASSKPHSSSLSTGAIAGIAVGIIFSLVLASLAGWVVTIRRKRRAVHGAGVEANGDNLAELDTVYQEVHEVKGSTATPAEMPGLENQVHMKWAPPPAFELASNEPSALEMHTPDAMPFLTPPSTSAPSSDSLVPPGRT